MFKEFVVSGDSHIIEPVDLFTTRLPGHLRERVPDLSERDVYLCGPPGMVAAIRASLRRAGVSRRQLHVERFAL